MGVKRHAAGVLAGAALALALSSCTVGLNGSADEITDYQARLTGDLVSTVAGTSTYHFEYGATAGYGSSTAVETRTITDTSQVIAVSARINGLAEGTEYHYRLCATDPDGVGGCGHDLTFTTATGDDYVTGSGSVFAIPQLGYAVGGRVDVSAFPGQAATGSVEVVPGTAYFRLPDQGPITCLRVEGNRASIGFVAEPYIIGDPTPPTPRMIFIEDNGATGDRWSATTLASAATTCPVVTAADFPDLTVPGMPTPLPPVLTSGNFVVHDHDPSTSP